MIFQYDGTPQGLLTAVFDGYPYRKNIRFERGFTPSFLPDLVQVQSNPAKSQRVLKYLKDRFPDFLRNEFKWAILADRPEIENDLALTIYLLIDDGKDILYSDRPPARAIVKNAKTISSEVHSYKGLLRFREFENGALYGPIRPKGNILYPLGLHFKNRLPRETFMIHDLGRGTGLIYQDGRLSFVEVDSLEETYSEVEETYRDLWRGFTRAISIQDRENKKLQRSNMPKRYWEFLTEMQDMI